MNHSTVKLTWDQDDPKRKARLSNNYKALLKQKEEDYDSAEEMRAYKGLIASSSEGSDDEDADSQDSATAKAE
jgi:hypothetical protein